MPTYNRTAAADYAITYALRPNPAYPPFPNDCTSFISQCLLAGGWTMIGGSFNDRSDDDVWWWGKSMLTKASYTWGGAHNFSNFIARSGRGTRCRRDELALGDLVQVARGGHVFHSTIVSLAGVCTVDGDGPFLSYHTTNRLNRDLTNFEAAFSGDTFLYWKVADHF